MEVPTPLRKPMQRIADVQCTRLVFQPGDRIKVDVNYPLDKDEEKKLLRSIRRWAGVDVRILIVDRTKMRVEIEKGNQGGLIVG